MPTEKLYHGATLSGHYKRQQVNMDQPSGPSKKIMWPNSVVPKSVLNSSAQSECHLYEKVPKTWQFSKFNRCWWPIFSSVTKIKKTGCYQDHKTVTIIKSPTSLSLRLISILYEIVKMDVDYTDFNLQGALAWLIDRKNRKKSEILKKNWSPSMLMVVLSRHLQNWLRSKIG